MSVPTPQQVRALKELLEDGVHLGKLKPDYLLIPHRCLSDNVSPGNGVVNEIKHFENYFANFPKYKDMCSFPP